MAEQKHTVLFTNLYLGAFTGSELHVLELARAFQEHGWDVTCYTFVKAYPLQVRFEESGIKVVEYGEEEQLDAYYDVLYAQHHVVSDYLLAKFDIAFKHIIVSMLGPLNAHELPPSFAKDADLAVFVSEECRLAHAYAFEDSDCRVEVFPNYANNQYFHAKKTPAAALSAIGVISNHVPHELAELKQLLPEGVSIDYLGLNNCAIEVTPEVLSKYNLVVTIGRTVQCCMAMGIPVYCYDAFGGPGYLAPEMLDENARTNFSGRSHRVRLDPEELWKDITRGYVGCIGNLADLRLYAWEHFCFEKNFDDLLGVIESLPVKEPQRNPAQKTPAWQGKCSLLASSTREKTLKQFGFAEWRYGDCPDVECEVLSFRYRYNTLISFEPDKHNEQPLKRFDPDRNSCICNVITPGLSQSNANAHQDVDPVGSKDTFWHVDPIYRPNDAWAGGEVQFYVQPTQVGLGTMSYLAWSREMNRRLASAEAELRQKTRELSECTKALEQIHELASTHVEKD